MQYKYESFFHDEYKLYNVQSCYDYKIHPFCQTLPDASFQVG